MNRFFNLSGALGLRLAQLAMLLLGALTLLISADVVMRNLGYKPLAWVTDAAEYILLYCTFLPMAALVRSKGHVFVDFIRASLPAGIQRWLEKLVYLICLLICAYLGWIATIHFLTSWTTGAYDARAVDLPSWLTYLPMAVGLWLAAIEWLRFLIGGDSMYDVDPLSREGY